MLLNLLSKVLETTKCLNRLIKTLVTIPQRDKNGIKQPNTMRKLRIMKHFVMLITK